MAIQQHHLIIQKLSSVGIPEDFLNLGQRGLVAFAANNDSSIHLRRLVSAILPTNDDENEEMCHESLTWLQWLMFQGEPKAALENLSKLGGDERGVCGLFWEEEIVDAYYQCRTCGLYPSSTLCGPCFENGNHEKHDYIMIKKGSVGYCDCGDITAFKREGFCSKHIGMELIQPLPEHVAGSLGLVLDLLFIHWREKLLHVNDVQMAANELTSALVKMLLEFGKYSESLTVFISRRACSSPGLLESLFRAERFMNDDVIVKVRELLLKLVGEPGFKSEFAQVFVDYYPSSINSVISNGSDTAFEKYQLVSTFSKYIFSTPPLTIHLVEKMELMGVLLQTLENIFNFCASEDGKLQVAKLTNFYKTIHRVVEDIRFIMNHSTVPKYLCNNKCELVTKLIRLLASMQGMNPQNRGNGSQLDNGSRNIHQLSFELCDKMSIVMSYLVEGVFSESDNEDVKMGRDGQDSIGLVEVGILSQKSCSGGSVIHESKAAGILPIASSGLWLVHECLRTTGYWLKMNNTTGFSSPEASDAASNYLISLKRKRSWSQDSSSSKTSMLCEADKQCLSPSKGSNKDLESMVQVTGCGGYFDNMVKEVEGTSKCESEDGLQFLRVPDWPDISYDVSSQAASVHIPLHRLLSMVLLRSLNRCCAEPRPSNYIRWVPFSSTKNGCDYFGNILRGCHPHALSAYLMEHPLRLRVFTAQVHAKLWMKNDDDPVLLSECYHLAGWYVQNLELDLFLLQFCAALAPPDLYVHRILERFGLSNYLSLDFKQHDEHEPSVVAEMLILLIQILKERAFCGFDTEARMLKDVVCKLAIEDTTFEKLVKYLSWDLSRSSQLQNVLNRVATCSHPSGATDGIYTLRPYSWKRVDFYHLYWNGRDRKAAEERYLQHLNVSPLSNQLPSWKLIYFSFKGVAKIATCKTMLQIVRSVLFYAVFSENIAPQSVLIRALHLLALALDACRVHKRFRDHACYVGDVIPLLAFACEEIPTGKCGDHSLLSLLVLLTKKMHEKENGPGGVEFSVLSSLLMNVIKKLVEVEPGFSTKLQELAPLELADRFSCFVLKGKGKVKE